LNKANGLPDDTISALSPDQEGGVWLSLGRGLSRAELGNRLSRFDDRNGLEGIVLSIHRHHGRLYAGTSQGLYVLESGPSPRFRRLPGIDGQTWALLTMGESLLVANYQGAYDVRGDTPVRIQGFSGSIVMHAPKLKPGNVYVGVGDGLALIRKVGDQWQDGGHIPGISHEVRAVVEDREGALWLGTVNAGITRLHFNGAISSVEPSRPAGVENFGMAAGLPSMSENYPFLIEGDVRFMTIDGIYRFDKATHHFKRDPIFSQLFPESRAV
jgi:ligand-binding sensor domain-containing protein